MMMKGPRTLLELYGRPSHSVSVEHAAHTLQYPVRDVLVGLQVSVEHQAHAHCVSSSLCHVDGGSNRASELKFVGLDWYNLHQWKLFDKLFGTLVIKTVLLNIPS